MSKGGRTWSREVYPGHQHLHHLPQQHAQEPPLLPRRRLCLTPSPPAISGGSRSRLRPISRARHLDNIEERNATDFLVSCQEDDVREFDALLQRCPSVTRRVIDEALRATVVLPEDEEPYGVAATVSSEQQQLVWDAEERERLTRRRLRAISARLHETNTGNIRRQHQMALHVQRFAHYQQQQLQHNKQSFYRDIVAFARASTPIIVNCYA